jgi:hypothetical protein
MTDIACPLDMFAAELRWVAWRNELRAGAKPGDKPTKVRYSPRPGEGEGRRPLTWVTWQAPSRGEDPGRGLGGGIGIELGELSGMGHASSSAGSTSILA